MVLLLLFGCFVKPLTVNAYVAYDPASAAVWAFLNASGFFTDTAEAGAQVIAAIINTIDEYVVDGITSFAQFSSLIDGVQGNERVALSELYRAVLATCIYNNPVVRSKLKHNSVDLTDTSLTQDEIPIIAAGVQMYVPTEAAMQDLMTITQMQVLYEGFMDQQVELSKETNTILNKIRIF